MSLFGLALIAATWPLWIPQQEFPQVPLVYGAGAAPAWFEWAGGSAILLGLCGALAAPNRRLQAAALVPFALGTSLMMLVDQERVQPWAYQFVLVALVLALADPRTAIGLLRLLIVSFYFHSALSKLDVSFFHTLGQQFFTALAQSVGLAVGAGSEPWRLAVAAIFPAAELLVAIGLCFARTRSAALGAALLLHVLLLVILGPWGLNHKLGVLIWNAYFIVQNLLLFWPIQKSGGTIPAAGEPKSRPGAGSRFASRVVVAAGLLPFLAPTGWFDLWPAWGLYASSAERVTLLVHRREIGRLPNGLRRFASSSNDPDDAWMTVRLDRWALEALGAPIYPQNRYQLGVAEAVISRYRLGNRARVVRWGLANRFTGERRQDVFSGVPQLLSAGNEYIFNTRPRQRFVSSQGESFSGP
ncbi:MAG TPA: hypothetical protein VGZ26_12825 [Pirellulales bacterium]|nr:hypothetical protein [Pirellulales bacterium]